MRRKVKTQADVDRYVKQDLGLAGHSRKVQGSVVNRTYHLLSDLEYAYWLQLDFSETVIDIREQFPLFPVPALQAIATSRGIDYTVYIGTKVPM
jgi:hypothetical protein